MATGSFQVCELAMSTTLNTMFLGCVFLKVYHLYLAHHNVVSCSKIIYQQFISCNFFVCMCACVYACVLGVDFKIT